MKKKLVLWGTGSEDQELLLAIELIESSSLVKIHSFPKAIATESFYKDLMDKWRSGQAVDFPEGHKTIERPLTITEDILPEDIKVERTDLILRAKTEWQFVVLSAKLYEMYKSELEDLTEKVKGLTNFDNGTWEELKGFWAKIQQQGRDRNLFREHEKELRDNTNQLFDHLKSLRKILDKEFQAKSSEAKDIFLTKLADIQAQIDKGLGLSPIFNELKKIQQEYRDTKLTRDDRNKVWNKLDGAFKQVKEKKYGAGGGDRNTSALARVQRRYDGLLSAIKKMENSISRDKGDINYQGKIIGSTDGQLEAQIRQAKIKMIEERISSKQLKLDDMLKTKSELEKRIESLKKKEAKDAEKKQIEQAKAKIHQKISKEIEEKSAATSEDKTVQAAAAAISTTAIADTKSDDVKEESGESIVEAITETVGESIENVVDTVKAVVEVVSDKVEEVVEDLKESMTEEE